MWTSDRYQAGGVGAKVVQHGDRGHSLQLNPATALHITEKHGMVAVCVVVVNKTVCDCL